MDRSKTLLCFDLMDVVYRGVKGEGDTLPWFLNLETRYFKPLILPKRDA
jgi:hypothetical protein